VTSSIGFRQRAIGAGVAASISLILAIVFLGLSTVSPPDGLVPPEILAVLGLGSALGVPVGAMLGYAHLEAALEPATPFGRVVPRIATWAVLIGAPAVALAVAFGYESRVAFGVSTPDLLTAVATAAVAVFGVAGLALFYGLLVFGLPAWILAAIVAGLWFHAVRGVLHTTARVAAPSPAGGQAPRPASPDAASVLGWVAVGGTISIAVALTALRAGADQPPGILPGGAVGFLASFGGPGIVSGIGLARHNRAVVVASGMALVCLAPLSFGGATLPLLIPATLLLYAAARMKPSSARNSGATWTAVLALALLIGAPVALFSTTETVCWDDHGGWIEVRVVSEMPTEPTFIAAGGSGCSSGSISALGGLLSTLAVGAAAALAGPANRGRGDRG
jgi:hypothetical protein